MVAEVLKPGTYKLVDEKGAVFTNTWNSYVDSTPRVSKFYAFLYILYRDPMNECMNKQDLFLEQFTFSSVKVLTIEGSTN